MLAAERTFAAWLRTGLAFLGGGLATQSFLADAMGSWPLRLLAFTLILCALACFAAAGWRDHWVRRRLAQPHITLLPRIMTLGLRRTSRRRSHPAGGGDTVISEHIRASLSRAPSSELNSINHSGGGGSMMTIQGFGAIRAIRATACPWRPNRPFPEQS